MKKRGHVQPKRQKPTNRTTLNAIEQKKKINENKINKNWKARGFKIGVSKKI